MASVIRRAIRFARSPAGKGLIAQAQKAARDPKESETDRAGAAAVREPVALGCSAVRIRAYRGGGGSSVYREHVVSGDAFVRILAAGKQRELTGLTSLDSIGAHELDKREARQLAEKVGLLRERSELFDLDGDLIAFALVDRWCARASGKAWLTIEER